MFPVACRPKGPANLEAHLLGNVIGSGEKTWNNNSTTETIRYHQKFTAIAGTITTIMIKAKASHNCKAAIYSDNSGSPNARLAYSVSTPVIAGWNALPLNAPVLLAATDYWLVFHADTANLLWRIATGGVSKYKGGTAYATAFAETAGAGLLDITIDYAIAGWGYPA